MKTSGGILMSLGALLALYAFSMDTSVYSSGTYIGGSYVGGGSTYNLGLLQQQMMVFQTGLAGFVAGAVLFAAAPVEVAGAKNAQQRREWWHARPGEDEDERYERVYLRNRAVKFIGYGIVAVLITLFATAYWMANHDPMDESPAGVTVDVP